MTEKTFWAIIDNMRWSEDHDYNRISKDIKNGVYGDKERMIELKSMYHTKEDNMMNIAHSMTKEEYAKYIDESDDGLWDVCSNVIGSGKKYYNSCIKNNSGFKKVRRIENFSYSFQVIDTMK